MAILVRWFYFFNWKNKSSFQQLFIKICCLKSFTFSLHLKCTLNNSQHINSDDTYMWIINSLVLWKKMLTTKLHIFLSSEKYLIIITTPFLKWLWTLVKMERRGLVLSCRKGQSRDRGDGIERGCQEISLWQVRFFSEIHVMFSLLTDFVTLAIHLIFPQTILRLEIKMSDRTDSHWYVWLKKKWILSPLSMCTTSFRKGGVAGLHARGNTKKGEWYSFSKYAGVKSGLCNQMRQIVSL